MKKKVHRLKISGNYPYKMLGISSHENDYRLSWALNTKLGIQFRRTENIMLQTINKENKEFSVFQYYQDSSSLKMHLISNRCPDGFLIKEMKNIDFFIQIFGEISQAELDEIVNKLKAIDLVSAAFEISPDKLKNRGNLPSE